MQFKTTIFNSSVSNANMYMEYVYWWNLGAYPNVDTDTNTKILTLCVPTNFMENMGDTFTTGGPEGFIPALTPRSKYSAILADASLPPQDVFRIQSVRLYTLPPVDTDQERKSIRVHNHRFKFMPNARWVFPDDVIPGGSTFSLNKGWIPIVSYCALNQNNILHHNETINFFYTDN